MVKGWIHNPEMKVQFFPDPKNLNKEKFMTGKEMFERMSKGEFKNLSLEKFVKKMQSIKWTTGKGKLMTEYPMTNEELEKSRI